MFETLKNLLVEELQLNADDIKPALRNGSPAGNCPRGPRGLPIFT